MGCCRVVTVVGTVAAVGSCVGGGERVTGTVGAILAGGWLTVTVTVVFCCHFDVCNVFGCRGVVVIALFTVFGLSGEKVQTSIANPSLKKICIC